MQNAFRKFFAPPVFPEDEDKSRSAAVLNSIGRIITIILVLRMIAGIFFEQELILSDVNLAFLVTILIIELTLYISRRGHVKIASLLLITAVWSGLSYLTWTSDGIRDAAFFGYFVPILMAGLLLGERGVIGFVVASALSGLALAYAETNQLIVLNTLDTPIQFVRDTTAIFVLTGAFLYWMLKGLRDALNRARATAYELSLSNKELSTLRFDLEQRVETRTSELEKRALQLEAVSSVARAIASVQDLDTLLPAITKLISQQFGFYHVGIFLLDEKQENAVLRASNSEGGMQMLNKHHSLPIDHRSIVGYSISHGEARIALDVGADSVYFNNPDLPETRSEMALPLRVTGRITGSLDVQSTQTDAFSTEDVNVLTTLADQVAIAIENSRSFSEAKEALRESRAVFEQYTRQEWSSFTREAKQTGYVFDGKQVTPLDRSVQRDTAKAVVQTGSLSLEKESDSIGVPIKLRGQTIGVLDVRSKRGTRQWKQDEIGILEAAAERAALALENARLVQSAQRRAARERAIGDISAKIGSVSNLESILQVAVEELGRKIGGATEVLLEITNSDDGQNDRQDVYK
ncbi:MAG TPA: GAF domain-containing protein [Anaerolineales bacterium]|nr:GAF domain-containing protein [Anaerolineales bacterium]